MFLTLYIPGLFGPGTRFTEEFIPGAGSLERFLSRARQQRTGRQGFHRTVYRLAGYPDPAERDVPAAAITRMVDGDARPRGWWMRADPVHLAADRHGLVLLDAASAQLDESEARALAEEIRPVLAAAALEIETPSPARWYVRLDHAPAIRTQELDAVAGREIQDALPQGADAGRWHRLLNELQMILHASEVNREREKRGRPPINSLWFWGAGALPDPVKGEWTAVHADDLFSRGLAALAGLTAGAVPDSVEALAKAAGGSSRVLVIQESCMRPARYADLEGWGAAVAALEDNWFRPALRLLRNGKIRRLEIVADGWRFHGTRGDLLKFWRRGIPFKRFVLEN